MKYLFILFLLIFLISEVFSFSNNIDHLERYHEALNLLEQEKTDKAYDILNNLAKNNYYEALLLVGLIDSLNKEKDRENMEEGAQILTFYHYIISDKLQAIYKIAGYPGSSDVELAVNRCSLLKNNEYYKYLFLRKSYKKLTKEIALKMAKLAVREAYLDLSNIYLATDDVESCKWFVIYYLTSDDYDWNYRFAEHMQITRSEWSLDVKKKGYQMALAWIKEMSVKGNARIQFLYGILFEDYDFVCKSAEQGYIPAMYVAADITSYDIAKQYLQRLARINYRDSVVKYILLK